MTPAQKLMFVYLYEHNREQFDVAYLQELLGLSERGVYDVLSHLKDQGLCIAECGHRISGEADTIIISLDKWDYLVLQEKFNLKIYEEFLRCSNLKELNKASTCLIQRLILFVTVVCGCRCYRRFPAERIAVMIGVDPHTVSKHLKILDAKGLLSVRHRWEVCDWDSPKEFMYDDSHTFFIKHLSIHRFFTVAHCLENSVLISYFSFGEIPYLATESYFCCKLEKTNLKNKNKIQENKSKKKFETSKILAIMINTWNTFNPLHFVVNLTRHLCRYLLSFHKKKGLEKWITICKYARDYFSDGSEIYADSQAGADEYLSRQRRKSRASGPVVCRVLVQNLTSKSTDGFIQKHCESNENLSNNNRSKPSTVRIKDIKCLILYVLNFNVVDKIIRLFGLNRMEYSKFPKPPTEEEIKAREEIISEINETTEEDDIKCLRTVILKNLGAERYKSLDIRNITFTKGSVQDQIFVEAESLFRAENIIKKFRESGSSILSSYKFFVDQEWREHKLMEISCCG
jgi:DNA-binding MarR family transcriptional regulator